MEIRSQLNSPVKDGCTMSEKRVKREEKREEIKLEEIRDGPRAPLQELTGERRTFLPLTKNEDE